jgi:hypothetical protein
MDYDSVATSIIRRNRQYRIATTVILSGLIATPMALLVGGGLALNHWQKECDDKIKTAEKLPPFKNQHLLKGRRAYNVTESGIQEVPLTADEKKLWETNLKEGFRDLFYLYNMTHFERRSIYSEIDERKEIKEDAAAAQRITSYIPFAYYGLMIISAAVTFSIIPIMKYAVFPAIEKRKSKYMNECEGSLRWWEKAALFSRIDQLQR